MEKKLNNLEEKFLMGKVNLNINYQIREKKFMINIHKKEREIR